MLSTRLQSVGSRVFAATQTYHPPPHSLPTGLRALCYTSEVLQVKQMTTTKRTPKADWTQQAFDFAMKLEKKYFDLVWYARSHPADSPDWDSRPAQIKHDALNAQARIQELYPDEIDQLCCPELSDWTHGYNSGALATVRRLEPYIDPNLSASQRARDIKDAEERFPDLDS